MRNKQNYQSDILLVTDPSDSSLSQSSDVEIINRVQDGDFGFSINRRDINQFGKFGRVDTRVESPPVVEGTFSYYVSFVDNEQKLGFFVDGDPEASFLKYSLSTNTSNPYYGSVKHGKNFFIVTSPEGHDANNIDDGLQEGFDVAVMSFSGCFINSYSLQASVGSLPRVSFSFVGSQTSIEGTTVPADKTVEPNIYVSNPHVNQNSLANANNYINTYSTGNVDGDPNGVSALSTKDMTILAVNKTEATVDSSEDIGTFLASHAQSVALSINMNRIPIRKLGKVFTSRYELEFPIEASLSFSCIVSSLEDENVYEEMFKDKTKFLDIWVLFKRAGENLIIVDEDGIPLTDELGEQLVWEDPVITPGNPSLISGATGYVARGCELVSKKYSQSIGGLKTLEITYSCQIGGSSDPRTGIAFIA